MNSDHIIRMAREAGATSPVTATIMLADESVIRFAALVAEAEREAIIDLVAMYGGPVDLEAAIRARGQA